jgi:hypothetical protein
MSARRGLSAFAGGTFVVVGTTTTKECGGWHNDHKRGRSGMAAAGV